MSAVSGKTYNLTLKFAELYHTAAGSRMFDIYMNGENILRNYDTYQAAKGKYIAFDTTITFTATTNKVKLEFQALKDNVSINGLTLIESTGSTVVRLNCGGSTMTIGTKTYYADDAYINNASAANMPTQDDWNKAVMLKYCNYGVCGNQFKWFSFSVSFKKGDNGKTCRMAIKE